MAGDPWRIFKDDPGRQETLKILWPALYECLAELDRAGPQRVLLCVLAANHPDGGKPMAVGRIINAYGHPACGKCIESVHGPGHRGWPLELERKTRS